MFDKFQRLKSFALNGKLEVKNEGLTDALRDLAGYCSLWYGYAKSKEENVIISVDVAGIRFNNIECNESQRSPGNMRN